MKKELMEKALEADPGLRIKWEEAVGALAKNELDRADLVRKRGSGKYVNPMVQTGWQGFVSGYLLGMECIRVESEKVEYHLALLREELPKGSALILPDESRLDVHDVAKPLAEAAIMGGAVIQPNLR